MDAAPFVTAAFDLASSCPVLWATGLQNWTALMSPTQAFVHGQVVEMPLAWGRHLPSIAPVAVAPAQTIAAVNEAPFTIWLVAPLRGGARRAARPAAAGGDGGGDNGTDPAASSSGAALPLKRPAASMASVLAAARGLQASRPSAPAVASAMAAAASRKRPAAKRPASAAASVAAAVRRKPAKEGSRKGFAKRGKKRSYSSRGFAGGCPYPDTQGKGGICNKRRQQIAQADGVKYCKFHAGLKDGRQPARRPPLADADRVSSRKRLRRKTTVPFSMDRARRQKRIYYLGRSFSPVVPGYQFCIDRPTRPISHTRCYKHPRRHHPCTDPARQYSPSAHNACICSRCFPPAALLPSGL